MLKYNIYNIVQGLVCKFHSQKSQEALNLLFTEQCYWAPLYMLFYTFFTQFAECTSADCK
jgi:hypothetical protein